MERKALTMAGSNQWILFSECLECMLSGPPPRISSFFPSPRSSHITVLLGILTSYRHRRGTAASRCDMTLVAITGIEAHLPTMYGGRALPVGSYRPVWESGAHVPFFPIDKIKKHSFSRYNCYTFHFHKPFNHTYDSKLNRRIQRESRLRSL